MGSKLIRFLLAGRYLVQCIYVHNLSYIRNIFSILIINTIIIIAIIRVPIVENSLTSVDDQKVGGNDLIPFKVLLMLNTDMCFISGILLVMLFKLSSVRLDMSRNCIKLKLLILEYDLLKPNQFSVASIMESTFSQEGQK